MGTATLTKPKNKQTIDPVIAELAETLGSIQNFLIEQVGIERREGERIDQLVQRAFKTRTTMTSRKGGVRQVLRLSEQGALCLLANRAKSRGIGQFRRVAREFYDGDTRWQMSDRAGRSELTQIGGYREQRAADGARPRINARLSSLYEKKALIEGVLASQRSTLEINLASFESIKPENRNPAQEAMFKSDCETEIARLEAELAPLAGEIETLKHDLSLILKNLSKVSKQVHNVPWTSDPSIEPQLEITVTWRLPGESAQPAETTDTPPITSSTSEQ